MRDEERPLTPMEAAHNFLGALYYLDAPLRQRIFELYFSSSDPYRDAVRDMVYAELPFWQLLDDAPEPIPFAKKQ